MAASAQAKRVVARAQKEDNAANPPNPPGAPDPPGSKEPPSATTVDATEAADAPLALPAPRSPRYRTLDHWRGVACLMIVVLHSIHYTKGLPVDALGGLVRRASAQLSLGVPFFFVISGYCIAATSDVTRRRPHAPFAFFKRRFRRIFPPYWAAAGACLALVVGLTAVGQGVLVSGDYGLIPQPGDLTLSQWLGNLTLTETWRPHLFGAAELKIVGPAWTLCYEEQFYAACGLLLFLAPRRFFTGAIGVTALTVLTMLALPVNSVHHHSLDGLFLDGRWLMFAEGVGVYWAVNYARSLRGPVLAAVALLVVALAIRRLPSVAADTDARNFAWERVGSTAFALALLLLHRYDAALASLRALAPIRFLGRICYSLYLIHWPVSVILTTVFFRAGVRSFWGTVLIAAPVSIACSLVAGWAFHQAVERRFLNSPS